MSWIVDNYPDVPGPAKFLNSGGLIGRAADLRAVVARVLALPPDRRAPWSNQYRWITLYIQERRPFGLDHRSGLFFAAGPEITPEDWAPWGTFQIAQRQPEFLELICHRALARFVVEGTRIRLPHGSRPCHLHFNGVCSVAVKRDVSRIAALMPWRG